MNKPPPQPPPLKPRFPLSEAEAMARLTRHRSLPAIKGPPKLSSSMHKLTSGILKEEGPGLRQLKTRWKDLVGEKLAGLSAPVKLTGKSGEMVLTLEVMAAAAPLFQHHGETLRQKLSIATGGELKGLKFVQRAATKKAGLSQAKKITPLSTRETEELESALQGIKSRQLSEALLAFGKAVYTQDR